MRYHTYTCHRATHTHTHTHTCLISKWNKSCLPYTSQPQNITALWPVNSFPIALTVGGLVGLGDWLHYYKYQERWSPISVLTGLDVEQLGNTSLGRIGPPEMMMMTMTWRHRDVTMTCFFSSSVPYHHTMCVLLSFDDSRPVGRFALEAACPRNVNGWLYGLKLRV